jgi:tellurite methyltransferase
MSNLSYWEKIYSDHSSIDLDLLHPSQFAAFCLNEIETADALIDVGCGNGRDSFFFSRYGMDVLGIDGSTQAIELCRETTEKNALSALDFHVFDFSKREEIATYVESLGQKNIALYSRFFLHALEPSEQDNFFAFCQLLKHPGMQVFLEFRTVQDEQGEKSTGEHYRRYLHPEEVQACLEKSGFSTHYICEGRGMAKYHDEDAYVCRIIAEA